MASSFFPLWSRFSVPIRLLGFFLAWLVITASPAQTVVNIPDPEVPQKPEKRTDQSPNLQLKRQLEQLVGDGSEEEADALLAATRQAGFKEGEVLAMCHLAGLYLEDEQTARGKELLREALELTKQVSDPLEAAWLMQNIGRMQRKWDVPHIPLLTPFYSPLAVVIRRLRNPKVIVGNRTDHPAEDRSRPEAEGRKKPAAPADENISFKTAPPKLDITAPGVTSVKIPDVPNFRFDVHYNDKWLNSLINSDQPKQPDIRQLSQQKKQRDANKNLSTTFAKQGDYEKAYQYYQRYVAYKDSLSAEVTSRRLAALTYEQNMKQKEAEVKLLQKDQQLKAQENKRQQLLLFGLTGCLGLFVFSSVLLVRSNWQKRAANRALEEQKQVLQQTIADLRQTQTQLIQAEKMASLGELMAGIAHEIQNPLNFVNNFSEVSVELVEELKEEMAGLPVNGAAEIATDISQNLAKIAHHGKRADAIVKAMLEHSRASTGQKQPTDLNALADEYLRLSYHGLRARSKDFQAQMTTEFDPKVGKVNLVPQEIGRVLLNLYNNAFYAVQQKQRQDARFSPNVTVRTALVDGAVELRVRDNGMGIPPEVINKIYQPFFTTKPTGEGTGLGLSLSYDIITKGHGGTIEVETEAGQYTEMMVRLPV
ncbi:sensor histidine kinase [Larkinella sp. VNQ87]|uniref:sensor histidine kinase n=1 Tax=Larkinella sp. VNQ87 TaxID=3400921 RepID=UPI003BFC044C